MVTAETLARHSSSEIDLGAQIARLQDDVSSIAATVGKIAERRMGELREDAQEGMSGLVHEGQEISSDVFARLTKLEASLEQTVRTQPLIAIGLASAVGFLLSEVTHRR